MKKIALALALAVAVLAGCRPLDGVDQRPQPPMPAPPTTAPPPAPAPSTPPGLELPLDEAGSGVAS